ncbi:MAG TPA: hypothetical protein VL263_11870 [Vicinamibacterales bacterium]|nr:hypothetical protein [Vicinamibacterales bacterium]
MPDTLNRLLAGLPSAEPHPARAAQTHARCRAHLERQIRSTARETAQASRVAQVWQPLAAVLGVAYLTEAIVEALRFVGPF